MKINAREIGKRIRALRMAKKMTQQQLADVLGITLSSVGRFEGGIIMASLDVLVELSLYFEVSLDHLVFGR